MSYSFANERSVATASFRKRGPYQWQAQVRKKGQAVQIKTFETRAHAEQWARAIEVGMDKGVFVSRAEAESTTLKELLELYAMVDSGSCCVRQCIEPSPTTRLDVGINSTCLEGKSSRSIARARSSPLP